MMAPAGRRRVLAIVLSSLFLLAGCRAVRPPSPSGVSSPAAASAASALPRHDPGVAAAGLSRPANPAERSLVAALMRETEQLRGLRFLAPVEVTIEDRIAMRAYVNRTLDDEQLQRARSRYLALGVLDPTLDVRGLLVAVMEEELIGYYDPAEKRLAVRADIARALEGSAGTSRDLAWRATVVHELVHALQDQHFGLSTSIEQVRSTDADNAFGALVEGDATLVMLGYAAKTAGESPTSFTAQPARVLSALSRTPDQLTGALKRAPALLREPLLFRYREGAHFCAQLYRSGGWARIDAAHRSPPESTLAIREAKHYLAATKEPAVDLPSLDLLTAHGAKKVDEDVLGGLELSAVLGAADLDASYVVSAWRGDRYAVIEQRGQRASVWTMRFATSATARQVAAAFERLGDPLRRVWRRGANVIVARGLDAATERALAKQLSVAHASGHPPRARPTRATLAGWEEIDLPLPPAGTRQAPPSTQRSRRARDAIAD